MVADTETTKGLISGIPSYSTVDVDFGYVVTQKKLLQDGMHRAAIKPLQNRILPPEKPDGTQKTEKNSII